MTTPTRGPGDDFIAGFLDDYFAESEEHLAAVRRALLALEDAASDPASVDALLEELFRSFHSLKGISAMVDVREAERVAHELESCLRALRDGDVALTTRMLSVLIDGTAALEGVIATRRAGGPAPDVNGVIERLASVTAGFATGGNKGAASATDHPGELSSSPSTTWRFTFVPSPALVERGVKVDTVRARLAVIGRITSVSPKVTAGGGIAFEFLITSDASPSLFEPWRDDGLTWERVDSSEPSAGDQAPSDREPATPLPQAERSILAPSHFVRVDLKRLDDVMRRVADLVVTRARLEEHLARVERMLPSAEWRSLQETTLTFERQLRDLREDVMRVRLVRVDEIFRRMPFVARDLSRAAGKEVRVVLSGQDTEIDKFIVERMMDPVLHLVRNAVSHGIEKPETRIASGKPAEGLVNLSASTSGEMVILEIEDDGAGIDVESVMARARAAGIARSDEPLDARTLIDVICSPGFSTRPEADHASGRGIGMAVVKTTVQELGGSLDVATERGRGTRFTIALPLTLAITDALIAVAAGHTFAVPQSSVREVIEIDSSTIRQLENNELIPYRKGSLPMLRLSELFALDGQPHARLHAFVIGSGQEAVALAVDRILGQREIVVRTMSDALLKIDGISGATELGDGRVVLILDTAALSREARAGARHRGPAARRRASAVHSSGESTNGALA
jgi:two-component system chemotaxis sensor kinase CheA